MDERQFSQSDRKTSFSAWISGYVPAIVGSLRSGYGPAQLGKDLFSGLTVGIIAIPLAIAFAIGAGATPTQGLWTAIIAGFAIAALGGSRYQVSGPTGAFVVIIAGIVSDPGYGMSGLIAATLMAGLMLMAMGFAGLGKFIKFIPYSVTTGFTTGIAVIIFSGQVKDFLGIKGSQESEFLGKLGQVGEFIGQAWSQGEGLLASLASVASALASAVHLPTLILAVACTVSIFLIKRFFPRLPAAVIAIVAATLATWVFKIPVETIGDRFPPIPSGFPKPVFTALSFSQIRGLLGPAFTIALLGAIESLLSAVVADGMKGDKHNSNMELVAQGAGNVLSAIFGGIPATGAIARTAANIKNGAQSPISGMVHALVVLLFVFFLGPVASRIPMAALAAVLVTVAWDMSEIHRFIGMAKAPKSDFFVMLLTFVLTVAVDLTAAVQFGLLASVILFVKRMSDTASVGKVGLAELDAQADADDPDATSRKAVPRDCEVFELSGPLFFGAADMLDEAMFRWEKKPRTFILRMRSVPAIDASGLKSLRDFHKRCKKERVTLILSGVKEQPLAAMAKLGLDAEIGKENIFPHIDQAIERARELSGKKD